MQEPAPAQVRLRVGEYEVDLRSGELRRNGHRIKLQQRPFQILAALVERPGEVVTREEIQRKLWPTDTFVDFEHSINTAVNKLREALGDDAENPRFIETLPRYGYRFIAAVEIVEASAKRAEVGLRLVPQHPASPRETPLQRRWIVGAIASAAATLLAAASVVLLFYPLPWGRAGAPPRITAYTQITRDGHAKILAGTDGSRLYFGQIAPLSIAQVAISGGQMAQVPVAVPGPNLVDVSPDGSSFLITSIAGGELGEKAALPLWNVRTLGSSLRRLPDVVDAAFSPDGNSVAYSTPEGDIDLVRSDGSEAHKLAPAGGEALDLAWSPDGGVIRFTRDHLLWEMSSSGSNLHQLLTDWRASSRKCCGRWTPDGKLFVFVSEEANWVVEGGEIWALEDRHGMFRQPPAEPVQLTTGPIRWNRPIPSKDGRRVFAQGITLRGELSRFDSRTGQFQPFLAGISAEGVSFSPDGRFLAYVTFPEGILWRANRDGSNPVQLTDPPMNVMLPRWSPDGAQIVFQDTSRNPSEIYIIPAEGGSPRRLLPEHDGGESDPTWSPDGNKVVFTSWGSGSNQVIRVLDLASRQVTTLPGSADIYSPRWSPDGRFIAAMSKDSVTLKIFDVETQRWSVLLDKSLVEFPAWSKDSRSIYVFLHPGNDRGVFRIHIAGGKAERIVDLKDWQSTGWYREWLGLDPTDAPLVLRDIGSDDIYALTLEQK